MSDRPPGERPANRLAHSTSPYLLQHAHNPVDWYEWGPEALDRARAEDRPILLSVGYSACHWCHVMERESFEDDAVAAVMNEGFVCVKVDREERPDIDEIYMAATLAMNGHGGWPMTVFLTPSQQPFFAGTYFPPEDGHGRPGFRTLLLRIASLWDSDRAALDRQAGELARFVDEQSRPAAPSELGDEVLSNAAGDIAQAFDAVHGGFGPPPKFPPTGQLDLLLRHHAASDDEPSLRMVTATLQAMARGGIYDHIGGGFARYSTDARWLVPHFEKMLYDNALLVRSYLDAWQVTQHDAFQQVVVETLDYVRREMTSPQGAFFSSTDADSEGEEGRFFVWTPEQVLDVLGAQHAPLFCQAYDIEEGGNWEGSSIPNLKRPLSSVAESFGLEVEALAPLLRAARSKLYQARLDRVAPGLDDKVLTAWNGLMIGAMAEGARVLGDAAYLDAATAAADFVLETLRRPDGSLLRTFRAGKAHLDGVLEDYAYLAGALVDVYEAGGAQRYLRAALALAERMVADFGDHAHGGFFNTGVGHEALFTRRREGSDGAVPNANAAAAMTLARLSWHFDRDDLRAAAKAAVTAYGQHASKFPRGFCRTIAVGEFLSKGPVELAFVGTDDDPASAEMRRAVAGVYLPNRVIAHAPAGRGEAFALPMLAGKEAVGASATAYICRDYACQAPITDAAALGAILRSRGSLPAANEGGA